MLDLETMGQVPGSAFISAGACQFGGGQILKTFYKRIDLQSCMNLGLRVDASTIHWWMKQSDAARAEFREPGIDVCVFLQEFDKWCVEIAPDREFELWGNGSDFDNALLATAYDYNNLRPPWKYFNNRCYRTVKNLYKTVPVPQFQGVAHNALLDASHQARHLMAMLPEL